MDNTETQKRALETLDNLISLQIRKLELLKELKLGLQQEFKKSNAKN
jgi:hypothetical protein